MREFKSASGFDEVELRLFRYSRNMLTAELRSPDGLRFASRLPEQVLKKIDELEYPDRYGAELGRWLFQGEVGSAFMRYKELVQHPTRNINPDMGLRIRLWLEPDTPALQRIRWEAIANPENGEPLSVGTAFSRFIRTGAAYTLNPERTLRMQLIISNPAGFEPFDTNQIVNDIQEAVKPGKSRFVEPLEVAQGGSTMEQLREAMQQEQRIIHLIAHSVSKGKDKVFVFDKGDGTAEFVMFEELAKVMLIDPNMYPPDLVFISAPLEPSEERSTSEECLGPTLIDNGAQAVLTVEAPMNPLALSEFTRTFYRVLSNTGVVDEAAARARNEIYRPDQWDWATPVLFTRVQENIQIFQQIGDAALKESLMGVTFAK